MWCGGSLKSEYDMYQLILTNCLKLWVVCGICNQYNIKYNQRRVYYEQIWKVEEW
jgi:hypothetical protein